MLDHGNCVALYTKQGDAAPVINFQNNNIQIKSHLKYLTHLSRMNFPSLIRRTSPFPILGVLGGFFVSVQIYAAFHLGFHGLPKYPFRGF